jgi:hypothetical protein
MVVNEQIIEELYTLGSILITEYLLLNDNYDLVDKGDNMNIMIIYENDADLPEDIKKFITIFKFNPQYINNCLYFFNGFIVELSNTSKIPQQHKGGVKLLNMRNIITSLFFGLCISGIAFGIMPSNSASSSIRGSKSNNLKLGQSLGEIGSSIASKMPSLLEQGDILMEKGNKLANQIYVRASVTGDSDIATVTVNTMNALKIASIAEKTIKKNYPEAVDEIIQHIKRPSNFDRAVHDSIDVLSSFGLVSSSLHAFFSTNIEIVDDVALIANLNNSGRDLKSNPVDLEKQLKFASYVLKAIHIIASKLGHSFPSFEQIGVSLISHSPLFLNLHHITGGYKKRRKTIRKIKKRNTNRKIKRRKTFRK